MGALLLLIATIHEFYQLTMHPGPPHLPRKAARREQSLHLDYAHTLGLQHFQARGSRVRRRGGVQYLRVHRRLQLEAATIPLRHRREIRSNPGDP